jgi:uncharacterized protein (DUF1697 family)
MNTFIALFRGINVGGSGQLPMQGLTAILESLGAQQVRTYIQSGNAVFQSNLDDRVELSRALSEAIFQRYGFQPVVLILRGEELLRAMAENPFPEAEADPASLHLGFFASQPEKPDLDKLTSLKKESERFQLGDGVFYLHAPEGVGRSRLAAGAEKALGVPMTDRNWKTVCKLRDLAEG